MFYFSGLVIQQLLIRTSNVKRYFIAVFSCYSLELVSIYKWIYTYI